MNGGGGFTWANSSEMMQNGIASAMAALLRHIGDDARNFLAGKEFPGRNPSRKSREEVPRIADAHAESLYGVLKSQVWHSEQ